MAKGYFFVEVEIADPAAYEAYRTTVPDIIAAHGGKILMRGGNRNRWMASCRSAAGLLSSSIALRP